MAAAVPTAGKRIAYLKRGLFSYSNVRTGEQLRAQFPEHEVEEIDVLRDVLRPHEGIVFLNLLHVLALYRGKSPRLAFYRTPYIFRKIRDLIRARLRGRVGEFAFSLQTQSLYDASVPGLPHFVYTDHTHLVNLTYPGFRRRDLFARAWIDLEQEVYRHARHVFTMSGHVRRSLVEQYAIDPRRTSSIGAGSNVDSAPLPLRNDSYANRTILFVGSEWQRKGGPVLLAAFERVLADEPGARLIIVGCDPPVWHAHIEVAGRISREEVGSRLARASVLCLPTRVEPFGIAVVEAFHQRLPVVATRIGALPDLVAEGESGRLVPPDDPAALAQALLELLRDPEKCARFGEHGHAHVQAHYTWEAVGRKLRAGIDAALGEA